MRARPIQHATWKHLWNDPVKQLAARIANYLDHYGEMTRRDLGQRLKIGGNRVPGKQIAEALKLLVRMEAVKLERINVSSHFNDKVGRPSWRLVLVSVPPSMYSDQQALALRQPKPRRKRHKQSQWFKDNVLSPSGRFYAEDAANVLFHVVNTRHLRKRPMIFTTKKPLNEWGKVLHDEDLRPLSSRESWNEEGLSASMDPRDAHVI